MPMVCANCVRTRQTFRPPIKQGYVDKKGKMTYSKRWLVVSDGIAFCFKAVPGVVAPAVWLGLSVGRGEGRGGKRRRSAPPDAGRVGWLAGRLVAVEQQSSTIPLNSMPLEGMRITLEKAIVTIHSPQRPFVFKGRSEVRAR